MRDPFFFPTKPFITQSYPFPLVNNASFSLSAQPCSRFAILPRPRCCYDVAYVVHAALRRSAAAV